MDVKGKIAVVTGGGSGYGLGIACALKNAGAKVYITGRTQAKLEAAAAENGLQAIPADASVGSDWDKVFQITGGVDILVNNAGFGGLIAPVAEQDDAGIISTINTNLTGVIMGCSRAGKIMMAQKSGIILNISSVCALYAWPGWSVYTAAKAGLSKFSHGLYTELRPYGVRVTCITPSWGQTDFNKAANISGASEDAALASQCIAPADLGKLVLEIIETPDHLAIPDVTMQPMIQDINPM